MLIAEIIKGKKISASKKTMSIIKAKLKSTTNNEKGKTYGFGRRRGLNLILDFVTKESGNVSFESFFAHFGDVSSSGNDERRMRNAYSLMLNVNLGI